VKFINLVKIKTTHIFTFESINFFDLNNDNAFLSRLLVKIFDLNMKNKILNASFYKFKEINLPENDLKPLQDFCVSKNLKGLIILAKEGINGTVSGNEDSVEALFTYLSENVIKFHLDYKKSWSQTCPFLRMKVRLKKEIVTMGVSGINPNVNVGEYVNSSDWNKLISDPDVVLIDTRNDYEVELGTFKGAINPNLKKFSSFPDWLEKNKNNFFKDEKNTKIAMFCTGGIRCEKSTAFLKSQGFNNVYHLDGGILKYLENMDAVDSLWEGECFVFDERVTVRHGLIQGDYELCRCCREPLSQDDKLKPEFEIGVSCPRCFNSKTQLQKERARERQNQLLREKNKNGIKNEN